MKRRFKSQRQTLVEYILIIVIVAISCIVVLGAFSGRLKNAINTVTQVFGGDSTDYSDDDGAKAKAKLKGAGQGSVDDLTDENN